ncbi:ABC transporter substrate-binding protein [Acrocarpospora sp. B8E8]|uniref:ABC transporter substrate-binding protein n=1 Tax=Acrocarpospora sp. B8E8 TaxID=3153572 RepID=UPI00325E4186
MIQHNTSGFASPKDRALTSPAQYAGKTYGSFGGPVEEPLLKTIVKADGGDPATIKTVSVGNADFFAATKKGIDFTWIFYAWTGIEAELRGEPVNIQYVKDYDKALDFYTPILITNETRISKDPELVKQFLAATSEGYTYAAANAAESAEILLAAAPDLDAELVKKSQEWLSPRYQDDAPRWGQQTLFHIVGGLLAADQGTVRVGGQDAAGRRGLIGYMPQQPALLPWRTIEDNVVLAGEIAGEPRRGSSALAREWLAKAGLDGFASAYPHTLSGGMQQRVAFLRALLSDHELLLLDEPFSALDAILRVDMHRWLLDIWEENRRSILFITHNVEEALLLSSTVYVFTGRPATVLERVEVPFARPRSDEVLDDPEFIRLKRRLTHLLKQGVGRPHGRPAAGPEGAVAGRRDRRAAVPQLPAGRRTRAAGRAGADPGFPGGHRTGIPHGHRGPRPSPGDRSWTG